MEKDFLWELGHLWTTTSCLNQNEGVVVVDCKKQRCDDTPLRTNGEPVERVTSFKYLGIHITDDLTWTLHTHKSQTETVFPPSAAEIQGLHHHLKDLLFLGCGLSRLVASPPGLRTVLPMTTVACIECTQLNTPSEHLSPPCRIFRPGDRG